MANHANSKLQLIIECNMASLWDSGCNMTFFPAFGHNASFGLAFGHNKLLITAFGHIKLFKLSKLIVDFISIKRAFKLIVICDWTKISLIF